MQDFIQDVNDIIYLIILILMDYIIPINNSEITDDEHSNTPSSTSKKKRAQSGSVGGFIANRRKRE